MQNVFRGGLEVGAGCLQVWWIIEIFAMLVLNGWVGGGCVPPPSDFGGYWPGLQGSLFVFVLNAKCLGEVEGGSEFGG